ncbi:hypothetical protein [Cohnella nanjingensis]|uniref:hypothetical protein n=1 Tax=Cohnella nanjingensis TaxID=1387779 RepID=UPI0028A6AEFA|nr:hypothetical protein [Cohnella nanjingensis]
MLTTSCLAKDKKAILLPEGIPSFVHEQDFETIDWEKKAVRLGDSNLIGNENRSAVIGADRPSLDGQKWMWHLWGAGQGTELTVAGFHKASRTVHPILVSTDDWTIKLGGPHNGADAHLPSTVRIPTAGEWAINLYADDKLFDTLIYEIDS